MRRIFFLACFLLPALYLPAADLTITVVDPQGAAVAAARVALYRVGSSRAAAVEDTAAAGVAVFPSLAAGNYRVQVLAPGFAPAEKDSEGASALQVQLRLATTSQSVVVSAEGTPLASEEAAADTSLLTGAELKTLNPASAADAVRFLPGVVTSSNGREGSLASLFVRGGDSRYNKVIIDGVTVNDPGGTFDFGVVPMDQVDRVEMVRGAESTLYGSDAMTSVVQMWTRSGSTRLPELRFGADGGSFSTAHGYASLAGARGRFDYNLFADQFNTAGQGLFGFFPGTYPNDDYSNSSQGANVGVALSPRASFRLRTRHSNSRTGVQSFWNFNGNPLLPPDTDQRARQNNFLASAELQVSSPTRWQHRLTAFEYHHRRDNVDSYMDPGRVSPLFGNFDFPFTDLANINRAGVEYEGEYWERSWARTTFGYRFEDENGFVGDPTAPPVSHGLRRNHDLYGQQVLTWNRVSLIGGLRFVHNESFGNKAVPRVAASALLARGSRVFSGTRLRFAYATGIKEPRLEESFAVGGGLIPNPNLLPEENRSFEAGMEQQLWGGKAALKATYFNNLFRQQIAFSFDPVTFISQYVNVNESLAHGAEAEIEARPWSRVRLDLAYAYTSTQILKNPGASDPLLLPGQPLLRRPKHSGTLSLNYLGSKWGADLEGVAMDRRPDSDFLGLQPPVTYAAGYARFDAGAWRDVTRRITAYVNAGNIFNRKYDEAAGFPALRANVQAGLRFRLGGE